MRRHNPGFLRLVAEARSRVAETDVEALRDRLERGDPIHLLDVREESEWACGHIPGAVHLGRGVLERDIEERIPDADAEIVLYCGGGYRSVLAADSLQRMGYANVSSLAEGFRGWLARNLPVSGGPPAEEGVRGEER